VSPTVFRLEVVNLGVDPLVFETGFERVPARDLRIIDLGIHNQRILVLRAALLAPEQRNATDTLAIQASGNAGIFRETGDSIQLSHVRPPDSDRSLAALGLGYAQA
jgi:hypothetical protein